MRAYLYDAEGVDREFGLDALSVAELGQGQLLWVDLDASVEGEVRAAAALFDLDVETVAALAEGARTPALLLHQDYFHVAVTEVKDGTGQRAALLDCVAGRNWVLTSHREPLEFPASFDERFRGESNVGRFGSADFVSALLNEQLLAYARQLEQIVNEIDNVEQLVLRDRIDEDKLLAQLISITQRLARLRRLLSPHREIYERLAHPNLERLFPDTSSGGLFAGLAAHLERTLDGFETTRQMVAGSLDLYTTLVAHGTNKVIKLLTVLSLTILPATFLTGLLGMDALPRELRTTTAFWLSLAAILLLMTTTLVVARRRRWI